MAQRSRPKPCYCEAYHFPHRVGSGCCKQRKDKRAAALVLAKRVQLSEKETLDLLIDIALGDM